MQRQERMARIERNRKQTSIGRAKGSCESVKFNTTSSDEEHPDAIEAERLPSIHNALPVTNLPHFTPTLEPVREEDGQSAFVSAYTESISNA